MSDDSTASSVNGKTAQRAATAVGFCAILLWATLAALSVSLSAVPPFQLMAFGFAIGALSGLPQLRSRAQRIQLAAQITPMALAIGVGGLFGYHMFYFLSLSLAPPVEANLINYLWPLLIVLLSSRLPDMEALSWRQIGGALLATAGAGAVLANDADLSAQNWMGYGAAFAAAVVWAAYS
ncbi:MAG: EamA family transporter, partial [Chitinophagales bacterium]|nr:EamA family transporter [Hyphomicrobiales bacterium]